MFYVSLISLRISNAHVSAMLRSELSVLVQCFIIFYDVSIESIIDFAYSGSSVKHHL